MKKWVNISGIIFLLIVVIFIYCCTSSIRYEMSDIDFNVIKQAKEKQDVDKLNSFLGNNPSPSAKLVIMSYLEKFKSRTSVPVLIKTLSFDLPWWDKFVDEVRSMPLDVRFGAYQVLSVYEGSILNELKKLVKENNSYEQLYAAALLFKLGYSENKAVLKKYQSIGGKFKEDVSLLTHKLAI